MNPQAKTVQLSIVKSPVEEINELHSEMNELAESAVQKAIRIGELLTEQKKLCKHGEWIPWIEDNLPFNRVTAHRYLLIYKFREKCLALKHLEDAYRITVPKDKPARKRKAKLQNDLILHAHGGAFRLEKPLASWHIAYNPDGSQSIICRQCWNYSSGGKALGTVDRIKLGGWFYECTCQNSKRDAVKEPSE